MAVRFDDPNKAPQGIQLMGERVHLDGVRSKDTNTHRPAQR